MQQLTLEQILSDLKIWRQNRKNRREPIPDSIWQRAIQFAKKTSVGFVSTRLSLDHGKLKRAVNGESLKERFVEVPFSTSMPVTFEFKDTTGSTFKITGDRLDIHKIISSFRG